MATYKLNLLEDETAIKLAWTDCRICGHVKMVHRTNGICMDISLSDKGRSKSCVCREFKPSDNIQYLEYLATKEKSKNRGIKKNVHKKG